MPKAAKILVIRFSAMGDVAMTAPVLIEFREAYPDTELLIVSRPLFKPFFDGLTHAQFHPFDPKQKHKGFFGLIKLFRELKKQEVTAVADLHNNLRSKILTLLFFFAGVKSATVDKGRKAKKRLTRKENKLVIPLKLTIQRYAEVFGKLGFPLTLKNTIHKQPINGNDIRKIGVSPFAQHLQKVYPLHKMESVLLTLAELGHQLFVFGGSEEERQIAEGWADKHQNITSTVIKMALQEELEFISTLDVMLSMDSSGMHLSSLKNVPVVSVWGATHPYAGFLGYGQSINDAVQIDLYCRPCSVYGNVPCYRGDFACMNNLTEKTIVDKLLEKLNNDQTAAISKTR
ncbi:glycosyltransferase family 9 protein [Pedobacter frigoris]|uniref:Glycosyltransferase family 9 protein n=1 Tax=Pedobacter frigoris TaxID=2571272 RepID=A0A4V5NZJ8_9SPHI|nr:glycosyltransferase family 9 protein [Pedobacter frigoris]TKC08902.1 glycosyltransferase family 9 protein [Pedobacter frigoris]